MKPKTGWANPGDDVKLVLDEVCDRPQNFFKFIPSKYSEKSFWDRRSDIRKFLQTEIVYVM